MTRPPSVLLLTDSNVFAGTERHILELAVVMRGQGYETSIGGPVPGALAERAPVQGIPIVHIAKGRTPDLPAVTRLRALLQSERVDIIHAHNGRTALCAAMAVRLSHRGAAVATHHFLTPHHATATGFRRSLTGAVHRTMNRALDSHVAISEAVAAALVERGECRRGQITVIHNGISDVAQQITTTRAAVRESLGLSSDTPMLLCPARLEPEKDVATLLNAMASVRKQHPRAVCLIAGEGSLAPALQEQARQLELGETVRFLGFRSDALSLMHAAEAVVLPAPAEPFGLVLLEAMALGKPVIATRAGGPLEIIVDQRTGLLVTPRDAGSFAGAISGLLANSGQCAAFGAAARERYVTSFTAKTMARKMSALYAGLLHARARAA